MRETKQKKSNQGSNRRKELVEPFYLYSAVNLDIVASNVMSVLLLLEMLLNLCPSSLVVSFPFWLFLFG